MIVPEGWGKGAGLDGRMVTLVNTLVVRLRWRHIACRILLLCSTTHTLSYIFLAVLLVTGSVGLTPARGEVVRSGGSQKGSAAPAKRGAPTPPGSGPAPPSKNAATNAEQQKIIDAANGFAFDLFGQLFSKDPTHNHFCSPFSVWEALALTANGAGGKTRAEMQKVLGLRGMEIEKASQANAALLARFQEWYGGGPTAPARGITLSIANAILTRAALAPSFVSLANRDFDARVGKLDVSALNTWIENQTHGNLKNFVNPQELTNVDVALLNAVYFKGSWQQPFPARDTKPAPFTRLDDTEVQVPMMHNTEEALPYYADDRIQAVAPGYRETGQVGAPVRTILLLPRQPSDFKEVAKTIQAQNWTNWTKSLKPQTVELGLPQFAVRYEVELSPTLSKMGMEGAFLGGFAPMGLPEDQISEVKHGATLKVNEQGTEATAVTIVDISKSLVEEGPTRVTIDHPFFLAIQDQRTGLILFMGWIVDPLS